jgi:hypothetical protein
VDLEIHPEAVKKRIGRTAAIPRRVIANLVGHARMLILRKTFELPAVTPRGRSGQKSAPSCGSSLHPEFISINVTLDAMGRKVLKKSASVASTQAHPDSRV